MLQTTNLDYFANHHQVRTNPSSTNSSTGCWLLVCNEAEPHPATLAATESVAAAREAATAMLSYNADTVEKDLTAARERLTGSFLAEYTKLVNEVVIPGSREKKISAVAEVPAAASVSATTVRYCSVVPSTNS